MPQIHQAQSDEDLSWVRELFSEYLEWVNGHIYEEFGVDIGKDVQIGSHCSIYSKNSIDGKWGPVVIEDGACIGTHSTIMPGVTIGKDAVVGAYSFVKEDVPAGATVVGIPTRNCIKPHKPLHHVI